MKEYQLLNIFSGDHVEGVSATAIGDMLYTMIRQDCYRFIDIKNCRELFDYILIRIRFDKLRHEVVGMLSYDSNGFQFEGHSFETLDEVEKALKNKAFL